MEWARNMIIIKTSSFDDTKKHPAIVHYETTQNPLDKSNWEYVDEYFLESNNIEEEIRNILGKLSNSHSIQKVNDNLYYAKDSNEKYEIFKVII